MTPEFFKNIGNLFYAVAKADKSLTFEEYLKFSICLDNDWAHYGDENIGLIKVQFNKLQNQEEKSEITFDAFIKFFKNNPELFKDDTKSLIIKTANEIAYAFAKINKSELKYVAKLSLAFKNL